jgi:drug/metabolite transporter (DMT)-like permease
MIFLLLSVFLSSLLFIGFKWLSKQSVYLLMVIMGNYISCIVTAFILNKGFAFENFSTTDIIQCLGLGILFFFTFYAMGYSSTHIGVGITGASTKMSLVIPVFFGTLFLNEPFHLFQIFGFIMALIAVVLISYNPRDQISKTQWLIPLFIFFSSGLIDTLLNIIQSTFVQKQASLATGIAIIFTGALISSFVFIAISNRALLTHTRSLFFGFLLGIPNYFSVYFLILALGSGIMPSNVFYMINNTSVMLLSFLLALILFKEKINLLKLAGIALAVIGIYLSLK